MKITCDVIRDLLPLYAEEIASGDSAELVREHLDGCESCRGVYAQMKKPPIVAAEEPGLNTVRRGIWKRRVLTALCAVLVVCMAGCWFLSWLTAPIYLDASIITAVELDEEGVVWLTFDAAAVGEETFQFEVEVPHEGGTYTAWTSHWLRMKWNEPEPRKITIPTNPYSNGIYYFTGQDGEELVMLYENPEKYLGGSVVPLPRLVLSYYTMLAFGIGGVLLIVGAVLRKKRAGKLLLGLGSLLWTYALCQSIVCGFTFASFFALQELKWALSMAVCFWGAGVSACAMKKR